MNTENGTVRDFTVSQVSCTSSEVDESLACSGEGVARAVEALQSHMWTGMRMKALTGPGAEPRTEVAEAASPESTAPSHDPGAVASNNSESKIGPGKEGQEIATVSCPDDDKCKPPDSAPFDLDVALAFDELDVDDELAGIEMLMAAVAEHKGKLSALPDDVRRARASELALKLMSALGMSDDEEDDAL